MRSRLRRTLGIQFAIAGTALSFYATAAQAQDVAYAQYTAEELDNLLAPVALYPDPILAQVLVAASYPDEIELAAYHLSAYGESGIDDQPWDTSVKAVAYYPPVLNLMADRIDWTTALGQAYVEQPNDVMAAVQSLRSMARAQGNLVTTQQHEVLVEDQYIRILPAQPRAVYVPVYDPVAVYHRPVVHLGAYRSGWSFGVAFPIGVWLSYDFDWRRRHVYYHGWDRHYRRGWVQRSRPYVVINNTYVYSRPTIVVANRGVFNRRVDYGRFDRYNSVHRHVTWERHHRADGRRYARSGPSWYGNGRNDRSNIATRSPSWDRSGRMRANDRGRRIIPGAVVTPERGRTNNGQRSPSWDRGGRSRQTAFTTRSPSRDRNGWTTASDNGRRITTRATVTPQRGRTDNGQRSPSWDRGGRNSQTDRAVRATRSPSWDRGGQARANNGGNRRAFERSTATPRLGRPDQQRVQSQQRAQSQSRQRVQSQSRQRAQSQSRQRVQSQSRQRAQSQPRQRVQSQQRAQSQSRQRVQSQQRAQSQPRQRVQSQSRQRAQSQVTSSQDRGSSRVRSNSTRGGSSSKARSAPARRERGSSPSRSNGGNGGKSSSKGRGGRSK